MKLPDPDLADVLKTHLDTLPAQVQEPVTKLTAPEPMTEQHMAGKLKHVTELKSLSLKVRYWAANSISKSWQVCLVGPSSTMAWPVAFRSTLNGQVYGALMLCSP